MVLLLNLRPESLFFNENIKGSGICYKIDLVILHSYYVGSVFLFCFLSVVICFTLLETGSHSVA